MAPMTRRGAVDSSIDRDILAAKQAVVDAQKKLAALVPPSGGSSRSPVLKVNDADKAAVLSQAMLQMVELQAQMRNVTERLNQPPWYERMWGATFGFLWHVTLMNKSQADAAAEMAKNASEAVGSIVTDDKAPFDVRMNAAQFQLNVLKECHAQVGMFSHFPLQLMLFALVVGSIGYYCGQRVGAIMCAPPLPSHLPRATLVPAVPSSRVSHARPTHLRPRVSRDPHTCRTFLESACDWPAALPAPRAALRHPRSPRLAHVASSLARQGGLTMRFCWRSGNAWRRHPRTRHPPAPPVLSLPTPTPTPTARSTAPKRSAWSLPYNGGL